MYTITIPGTLDRPTMTMPYDRLSGAYDLLNSAGEGFDPEQAPGTLEHCLYRRQNTSEVSVHLDVEGAVVLTGDAHGEWSVLLTDDLLSKLN